MARRNYDETEIKSFNGGVDFDSSPFNIPDDCLQGFSPMGNILGTFNVLPALNVGGIQLINGFSPQNPNSQIEESSSPVTVNGLISFYSLNSSVEYFIATAGADIWQNSPEGTWGKITGSLTITNSQDNLASMAPLNNYLYGVDRQEDQFWYWGLFGNAIPVPIGALYSVTVDNAGTGYVENDILTLAGGTGGQIQVTQVQSPGGQILAVSVYNASDSSNPLSGSGYSNGTGVTATGGAGSGATFNITAVTPTINGSFLVNFNNTIFVNAGSELPTALYYSDLNIGYSINPVNFLSFNTGQGTYLTGAVNALFGNMIVFKNKSIHVVSPTGSTPAYANNLWVDGIGCCSHQSIVTLPGGDIMFWDLDDIYRISGNEVIKASLHPTKGTPRLKNFFRNMVNPGRLKYVCGAYYESLDTVFWFYSSPTSNSNDQCLAYHVPTQSFWPLTLRGSSCAVRQISGQYFLYTGNTDGFIYQQDDTQSFNGSSITWGAMLAWQSFGDIMKRKKGDLFYGVFDNPNLVAVYADIYLNQQSVAYSPNNQLLTSGSGSTGGQWSNGADSNVFDTAVFATPGQQLMEESVLINTLFKSLGIYLHGSNLNQPLALHKVIFTTRELELSRMTD